MATAYVKHRPGSVASHDGGGGGGAGGVARFPVDPDEPMSAAELQEQHRLLSLAGIYHRASHNGVSYTQDEAIDAIGHGPYQWRLMVMTGLGIAADSMEMMLLPYLQAAAGCAFHVSDWGRTALTVSVFVGMFLGAFTWGTISDRYGRRVSYFGSTALTFVFGLASAMAPNFALLVLFRALVGFSVSGSSAAYTLYAEFLPGARRGPMLAAIETFWAVGTCLEALLAWAVLDGAQGWRLLLVLSSVPVGVMMLVFPLMPESPRFLLLSGRRDVAETILQQAATMNGRQLPPGRLQAPVEVDQQERGRMRELFSPTFATQTVLFLLIWFCNTTIYYGVVLFTNEVFGVEAARTHRQDPEAALPTTCVHLSSNEYADALITSAAEFPGIIFTGLAINYSRKLTQSSQFAMTAFCLFLWTCVDASGVHLRVVDVVTLFGARAAISGAFQATYVHTPESYPTSIRNSAMGFMSSASRLGGMFTPMVANVLSRRSLYAASAVYMVFCAVATAAACLLPHETAGQTLSSTVDEQRKAEREKQEFVASIVAGGDAVIPMTNLK